jgi:hypothetical protein
VLAYYRKSARWPITSFEATGQNDPNVVMGVTKLWRNFERSFVFIKRSGRVTVALQHVALVKRASEPLSQLKKRSYFLLLVHHLCFQGYQILLCSRCSLL